MKFLDTCYEIKPAPVRKLDEGTVVLHSFLKRKEKEMKGGRREKGKKGGREGERNETAKFFILARKSERDFQS